MCTMNSDKELLHIDIERYMVLQRILDSEDREKEIRFQMDELKLKLEASGVPIGTLTDN